MFNSLYILNYSLINNSINILNLKIIIKSNNFFLEYIFIYDFITIIMYFIIILISFIVNIFSFYYMKSDPHINKFISYLSLFTFFMIFLVSSENMIQLFFGWEGVGLTSYLLISYWYNKILAIKSATKAILVNKLGDISFILTIILIWYYYGTINFLNIQSYYFYESICPLIGILILVSATSKSSQFGLHTWLPDAMEGPTPVSALIHAATMVTAGIFFIIRFSNIIENSFLILFFIIFLSSLTSIFAASISLIQNDFKKIIAYSTCSQLGYMLLICGLSNYYLSLFHLFNHAFFKSLLFLSAGLIIHTIFDEQDIRKTGSIINKNPISSLYLLIGNLALIGFPFFSGYYSKDLILEISLVSPLFIIVVILNIIAAWFTAIYSIRLFYYVYINNYKGSFLIHYISNKNNLFEIISLFLLILFSIFIGYLFKNFILFDEIILINNRLKYIPFLICIISLFIMFFIINYYIISSNNIFSFIINSYFINNIINYYLNNLFTISLTYYKLIDIQIINKVSLIYLYNNINKVIILFNFYNRGLLFNYLIFLILFFIIIK